LHYKTGKQSDFVAQSSEAAETKACATLVLTITWLRSILTELGLLAVRPTYVLIDNSTTLLNADVGRITLKNRSYGCAVSDINLQVSQKRIKLFKVSSEFNYADYFTKLLPTKAMIANDAFICARAQDEVSSKKRKLEDEEAF
jgi:hypothetical protein